MQLWQRLRNLNFDRNGFFLGLAIEQRQGRFHAGQNVKGLFLNIPASRLDARQVENVVDEIEEIAARMMNVAGVVLVGRKPRWGQTFRA